MEGKLFYLERTGPPGRDNRSSWYTVNGTGVLISQAQIPQAPPPLFTIERDRIDLLNHLTTVLTRAAEPGGSPWCVWILTKQTGFFLLINLGRQLHHIGEIKNGYCSGGTWAPMVSVIVVRHRVVEGVQTSQALEKA